MKKTMNSDKRENTLKGKNLENLFWAYVNNKMMILLMLIEHPEIAKGTIGVEKQKNFLHDLRHHFLSGESDSKYHEAFEWLEQFLGRYPNVSYQDTYRAIQKIELVYEAFGRKLDPRIEAMRIKREMVENESQAENGHHGTTEK